MNGIIRIDLKVFWAFASVSVKSIGHPAPFPEGLPHRLIQLYTFEDEIVLDPFCGSGSACLAALKDNRSYVGYEIDKRYVKLSQDRICAYQSQPQLL